MGGPGGWSKSQHSQQPHKISLDPGAQRKIAKPTPWHRCCAGGRSPPGELGDPAGLGAVRARASRCTGACRSGVRPQASAEPRVAGLAQAKKQVLSAASAALVAVSLAASPALASSQLGYAQKPVQSSPDLASPASARAGGQTTQGSQSDIRLPRADHRAQGADHAEQGPQRQEEAGAELLPPGLVQVLRPHPPLSLSASCALT